MAVAPARARSDYDYYRIKLLLVGDSGVGKSCLFLRFSDDTFTTSFNTTIGFDLKIRTVELDGNRIKLQIWDTAGHERYRNITRACCKGAMGILVVYDVTNESSFNNIRNWMKNIEQHASDNVNKILVGNKADMDESKRAIPTAKGQALADEYGIKFFETSAKTNLNVESVFLSIAKDIKQRLTETDTKAEPQGLKITKQDAASSSSTTTEKSACCSYDTKAEVPFQPQGITITKQDASSSSPTDLAFLTPLGISVDLEVKPASDPSSVAFSLYTQSLSLLNNCELTDLQKVFLSLFRDILDFYLWGRQTLEWESKLISIVTKWILVIRSMDLGSQLSEPVLELKLLFSQKIPLHKFKTGLISPMHQIYSIVVSSPESKPKWLKIPKNLTFLSPQLQLHFEKGKFCVAGNVEWSHNISYECWAKVKTQGIYLLCKNCNGKYHEGIMKAPVEIKNHHLHPKHHLQLATTGFPSIRSRKCYCCDDDLLCIFYYCSACDFAINVSCVEKPPLSLSIDHPKRHEHTLALFARHAPLTCSLCAFADTNSPVYMCAPCGFAVHLRCINNLPHVIRISRHPHRIYFTHSFDDQGDQICGVCRTKMDNDYGGYSCIKDGCSFVAHSTCATQSNVWDGEELEGEPEEVEDDVEPFVRISDGIIQHFSHQNHHLRLVDDHENKGSGGDYDDNKLCQACITTKYFGNFYSCMECDFTLHEACANLPRKMYHPIHPHQLVLLGEYDDGENDSHMCSACSRSCTGFTYKCGREACNFGLHIQCATVSEPLVHESHVHPLFLTSKPGEKTTKCSVCGMDCRDQRETFNCIRCEFNLCFACATLPHKVRYKHDSHMLTLSYGEETTRAYWCEVCEMRVRRRFYKCDEHCSVTIHVDCLLGSWGYLRPGSLLRLGGISSDVVRSNQMTRPICRHCKRRCEDRNYFHRLGFTYCSLNCSFHY